MRSLEEWLSYVDQQVQQAKNLREGKKSGSELKEDEAADPDAKAAVEGKEAAAVGAESQEVAAIPRVSAEGRALLSWETTHPHTNDLASPARTNRLPPADRSLNGSSPRLSEDRLGGAASLPHGSSARLPPAQIGCYIGDGVIGS